MDEERIVKLERQIAGLLAKTEEAKRPTAYLRWVGHKHRLALEVLWVGRNGAKEWREVKILEAPAFIYEPPSPDVIDGVW